MRFDNLSCLGYHMPGVEIDGFRIVVNTRDERGHRPHVHVIKARSKCKIFLNAALTPYDVLMSKRDVKRARTLVAERFGYFLDLWEQYNG
jgi:Domain of unknown function (DUF4160)